MKSSVLFRVATKKKTLFWFLCLLIVASVIVNLILVEKEPRKQVQHSIQPWWHNAKVDLVVKDVRYFVRQCRIFAMHSTPQEPQEKSSANATVQFSSSTTSVTEIFSIPVSTFTSCRPKSNPLSHDGEYLIFNVCEMTMGAGGCSKGRYRSADHKHWEEYIGITWIKGEQYEAWRTLGSTSSKADSVKKVVNK